MLNNLLCRRRMSPSRCKDFPPALLPSRCVKGCLLCRSHCHSKLLLGHRRTSRHHRRPGSTTGRLRSQLPSVNSSRPYRSYKIQTELDILLTQATANLYRSAISL